MSDEPRTLRVRTDDCHCEGEIEIAVGDYLLVGPDDNEKFGFANRLRLTGLDIRIHSGQMHEVTFYCEADGLDVLLPLLPEGINVEVRPSGAAAPPPPSVDDLSVQLMDLVRGKLIW